MKAHIGIDAGSGLVHEVTATTANEADINQAANLLHGKEKVVFADAGYTGMDKHPEVTSKAPGALFLVTAKPNTIRAMKRGAVKAATKALKKAKASARTLVEHPFQIIKRRFEGAKARYRGIGKDLAKFEILFALANLVLAKRFIVPTARIPA